MSEEKLTPETQERILASIRGNMYLTTAAAIAGVDRRSVYRWKERGEQDIAEGKRRTKYAVFAAELSKAEAEAELVLVQKVQNLPSGPLEILKRRYPERWGDKNKTELTGPGGTPIQGGGATVHLHMETNGQPAPFVVMPGAETHKTDEQQAEADQSVAQVDQRSQKTPPAKP